MPKKIDDTLLAIRYKALDTMRNAASRIGSIFRKRRLRKPYMLCESVWFACTHRIHDILLKHMK